MDGQHASHGVESTDVLTILAHRRDRAKGCTAMGQGAEHGCAPCSQQQQVRFTRSCSTVPADWLPLLLSTMRVGLTLRAQVASSQHICAAALPVHSLSMRCAFGCSEDEPLLRHQPWACAVEV